MLALDSSGTLLVSIPSQGRIVALPAAPRPQRLRSPVTVAEGLRLPHGLAVRDGHLWVAETGRVLRFRYDVTTRRATEPVVIIPDLPAGAHHWTRSIAFGPDGGCTSRSARRAIFAAKPIADARRSSAMPLTDRTSASSPEGSGILSGSRSTRRPARCGPR
jgi:hypothetical protein